LQARDQVVVDLTDELLPSHPCVVDARDLELQTGDDECVVQLGQRAAQRLGVLGGSHPLSVVVTPSAEWSMRHVLVCMRPSTQASG
jgi:hypothetical protein